LAIEKMIWNSQRSFVSIKGPLNAGFWISGELALGFRQLSRAKDLSVIKG